MPAPKTDYGRELMRLLHVLRRKQATLGSRELSVALIKKICRSAIAPSDAAHRSIVASLNALLRHALKPAAGRTGLFDRLSDFDWIVCDRDRGTAQVDGSALLAFAPDRVRRFAVKAAGERLEVVIEFRTPLRAFTPPEQKKLLQLRQLFSLLRQFSVAALCDGCTDAVLRVDAEQAEQLLEGFAAGALEAWKVAAVYPRFNVTPGAEAFSLPVEIDTADAPARLARSWRRACRVRWLRALAASAADSLDLLGALALPFYRGRAPARRALRRDVRQRLAAPSFGVRALGPTVRIGFVPWPALAVAVLGAGLLLCRLAGLENDAGFGIASALALALAGSLNCAISAGPLSGAAGAAGLVVAFGGMHALLAALAGGVARLARMLADTDPFVAIVGGVTGTFARELRRLPPVLTAVLLAATGVAIVWSGWVMIRSAGVKGPAIRKARWRPWFGTIAGACAGSGIGGIFGLTVLTKSWFGSAALGFGTGFMLLGGLACAVAVWLAIGDRRRALAFGLGHALVTLLGIGLVHASGGTSAGLVVASAATGYFHATFFMAALWIGWALGGPYAAVAAAGLEGAGGYLGFVLSRLI